jgi:hypothetical protein
MPPQKKDQLNSSTDFGDMVNFGGGAGGYLSPDSSDNGALH